MSRRFTVSLSDDTALQMLPRGEGIALVAKTMKVDARKEVDLLFSIEDELISKKRIVLMAE